MGQSGQLPVFVLCGSCLSELALSATGIKGQVGGMEQQKCKLIPPSTLGNCRPGHTLPLSRVCGNYHLHAGASATGSSVPQTVASPSSDWPHLWTAAQIEMATLDLDFTGTDSADAHSSYLCHRLRGLSLGLVHHHPEKVISSQQRVSKHPHSLDYPPQANRTRQDSSFLSCGTSSWIIPLILPLGPLNLIYLISEPPQNCWSLT